MRHSPCEYVELEIGNVVVARQIDGRFQCHRLQARRNRVHLGQLLAEDLPRYESAVVAESERNDCNPLDVCVIFPCLV